MALLNLVGSPVQYYTVTVFLCCALAIVPVFLDQWFIGSVSCSCALVPVFLSLSAGLLVRLSLRDAAAALAFLCCFPCCCFFSEAGELLSYSTHVGSCLVGEGGGDSKSSFRFPADRSRTWGDLMAEVEHRIATPRGLRLAEVEYLELICLINQTT